ncbi:hypothetical protein [Promicromonospora aerolata]|uniref:Uncharacterized protein n=1 Tax=Promicromonospora aerolata TaxID=195749 RepID=A0ABW4VG54_9MICO
MNDESTAPEPNPILTEAVESIMTAAADAFAEVWSRPNAPQLVEGFLAGRVSFHVERSGLSVLVAPADCGGDAV